MRRARKLGGSSIIVNDKRIETVQELQNAEDIKIIFCQKRDKRTLALIKELNNVYTINSVNLKMEYILNRDDCDSDSDVEQDNEDDDGEASEVLRCLSIGIGQQTNLNCLKINIFLSDFDQQSCKYLINCFRPSLSSLSLTFDKLEYNQLQEISKGLTCINNLLNFEFIFQNKKGQKLTFLYEVIQNWKQLKSLVLVTENQYSQQTPENHIIQQDMAECEFLQTMINDLNLFSTFQKAEKLKSISLIIKESTQNLFNKFEAVSLPNLLMLKQFSLELIIYCYDDLIKQFLRLIFEKLQNINHLFIKFFFVFDDFRLPCVGIPYHRGSLQKQYKEIDFGSTFSFLLNNPNINYFSLTMRNLMIFNQTSDMINLKFIQHLNLNLNFVSFNDQQMFFRAICQLKNLLSLIIQIQFQSEKNKKVNFSQYFFKPQRLVLLKIKK